MHMNPRSLRLAALAFLLPVLAACSDDGSPTEMNGPPDRMPERDDTTPPNLISFSFSPRTVDIANQNQEVVLFARVEDDGAGVENVSVQWQDRLGANIDQFVVLRLVDGNEEAGNYEGSLIVPQSAVVGTWTVLFVRAEDQAGNTMNYPTDDLRDMGMMVELDVNG